MRVIVEQAPRKDGKYKAVYAFSNGRFYRKIITREEISRLQSESEDPQQDTTLTFVPKVKW